MTLALCKMSLTLLHATKLNPSFRNNSCIRTQHDWKIMATFAGRWVCLVLAWWGQGLLKWALTRTCMSSSRTWTPRLWAAGRSRSSRGWMSRSSAGKSPGRPVPESCSLGPFAYASIASINPFSLWRKSFTFLLSRPSIGSARNSAVENWFIIITVECCHWLSWVLWEESVTNWETNSFSR